MLSAALIAFVMSLVISREYFRRYEMLENDKLKQWAKREKGLVLLLIINRPNSDHFQFGSTGKILLDFICGVEIYLYLWCMILHSDWQLPNKESCPKDLHSNVTRQDRTCTELNWFSEVQVLHLNWSSLSWFLYNRYDVRNSEVIGNAEMGLLECHRGSGKSVSG